MMLKAAFILVICAQFCSGNIGVETTAKKQEIRKVTNHFKLLRTNEDSLNGFVSPSDAKRKEPKIENDGQILDRRSVSNIF